MPERAENGQYSTWVGLVFIFNLIVGTGALTLPAVFSRAGWLLGTIVISILAFMSYVTVTFIIEAMASANAIKIQRNDKQRKRVGVLQETPNSTDDNQTDNEAHRDLGESPPSLSDSEDTPLFNRNPERIDRESRFFAINEKIELGEMAFMFFNKAGKITFYICLTAYLYGDLSIYGAVIGKSSVDIFCTYMPKNFTCNDTIPDTELCWENSLYNRFDAYRLFLTIFILFLGPFVFFNLQKTTYLQIMTSFMRWIAFSIMISYASWKLVSHGQEGTPPYADFNGVPGLFGACVYSFMCHHSLPAVLSPISDKSKLKTSLGIDYILISVFYVLLAVTGAFAFKHLHDLYTLDFGPRGSGDCSSPSQLGMLIVQYFLAFFPIFTLSTSFPIIGITLRNNLQSLFLRSDQNYNLFLRRLAFPSMAILPPYFIAMCTDNLKTLVGITGTYGGAAIQYLVPIFLVYFARKKTQLEIGLGVTNKFASPFKGNIWLVCVFIWAIACMIFVTVHLVEELIKSS